MRLFIQHLRQLACVLALGPVCGMALALSPCEDPVFQCDMAHASKRVQVCEVEGKIRYEFGPRQGPAELVLRKELREVKIEPWNGMGWEYWASMELRNGAWGYRLFTRYARGESNTPPTAGITVLRDGKPVRDLMCRPETLRERIETLLEKQG